MYAVDSLRLEKRYRGWKSDMTLNTRPLMASLDRFVDFRVAGIQGMAALAEELRRGIEGAAGAAGARRRRRRRCAVLRGGLAERHARRPVTSAGYGHAIGRSIALAYVRSDLAAPDTRLEIEILGERRAAVRHGSRSTIRRMKG